MSNQPIQIIEHRMRVFSGAEADGVRQAGVVGTGSDQMWTPLRSWDSGSLGSCPKTTPAY